MSECSFVTGSRREHAGAGISVTDNEVCIDADDFAGTFESPVQSASHCFEGEDRTAFLKFCAEVAATWPVPDDRAVIQAPAKETE